MSWLWTGRHAPGLQSNPLKLIPNVKINLPTNQIQTLYITLQVESNSSNPLHLESNSLTLTPEIKINLLKSQIQKLYITHCKIAKCQSSFPEPHLTAIKCNLHLLKKISQSLSSPTDPFKIDTIIPNWQETFFKM